MKRTPLAPTLLISLALLFTVLLMSGCKRLSPNDPDDPTDPPGHSSDSSSALRFNGSTDYIRVPTSPALSLSASSFTVEAWVKPHSLTTYTWAVSKATSNPDNEYMIGFDWDGAPRFITRGLSNDVRGITHPQLNHWYHLAGVQDVENHKVFLYVNGVLEATVPLEGEPSTQMADILLGVRVHTDYPGVLAEYFDGEIDEVRIWSQARSQSQIHSSMHHTVEPTTPGLAAYWRFDNGTGIIATDLAGDHNGTFGGYPRWISSTAPIEE